MLIKKQDCTMDIDIKKIKVFSLVELITGLLLTAMGIIVPCLQWQSYVDRLSSSGGIIGGAGMPSFSFFLGHELNGWPYVAFFGGIALVLSAVFCLIFDKTVKSSCSVGTSAISLALSAVGGAGLNCAVIWLSIVAFDEMSHYPIEYPASIVLGLLCLFVFAGLVVLYLIVRCRRSRWSLKGFIIDILTSVIYLPAFFAAFMFLYGLIA